MAKIIKANWVRRLPAKPSHVRDLEAKKENEKQERIAIARSLVGSTDRLEGVVRRIERYGVFVDFEWGRGLVHVSEMSRTRIHHPNEIVEPGKKLYVYVISVDDLGRIRLSMIGPGKPKKVADDVEANGTTPVRGETDSRPKKLTVVNGTPPTEGNKKKGPLRSFAELKVHLDGKQGRQT